MPVARHVEANFAQREAAATIDGKIAAVAIQEICLADCDGFQSGSANSIAPLQHVDGIGSGNPTIEVTEAIRA